MKNKEKKVDFGLIFGGILLVLFGIVFVVWPDVSLGALAAIVGAAFFVSGIFEIVSYFRCGGSKTFSRWMLADGIVDILLGLLFLIRPFALAFVVPWLVAIGIIVAGVVQISTAIRSRKIGVSFWGIGVASGILSILFAVLIFLMPALLAIYIGLFAIMRGIVLVIAAFNTPKYVEIS